MPHASKPPASRSPVPPARRRATFRKRQRSGGLRPIEICDPAFADKCRQQARAIAAGDPAGDALMDFVDQVYEWPEDESGI